MCGRGRGGEGAVITVITTEVMTPNDNRGVRECIDYSPLDLKNAHQSEVPEFDFFACARLLKRLHRGPWRPGIAMGYAIRLGAGMVM